MRDSSLDDFLGGDEESSDADPTDGADEASEATDGGDAADEDAVEPAVSTYDWTPAGADCEACEAVVERRWRDDGRLVCADCKEW